MLSPPYISIECIDDKYLDEPTKQDLREIVVKDPEEAYNGNVLKVWANLSMLKTQSDYIALGMRKHLG